VDFLLFVGWYTAVAVTIILVLAVLVSKIDIE
jgi:hypothetical protein